jgi:hemoglobin/transferrin/lactoferrin receptor protein
MRIALLCLTVLVFVTPVLAEPDDDAAIVVTATRRVEPLADVPAAASSIAAEILAYERAARSLPEALAAEPGVLVQKTSNGQTSPYVRGFTGFRTLLLVDGIRLNNSVFREGPNQYWGLVDPLAVGRLEVVYGPSSVLFGSDAVGGTANAIMRSAPRPPDGRSVGGRFYGRVASAERSGTGRMEVHAVDPDLYRFTAGVTLRQFGDFEAGEHVGTVDESAYDEQMADARLEMTPSEGLELVFAWQRARQDDVPRTHSTRYGESWRGTSVGSDLRRDLDEARDLVYARAVLTPADSFLDRIETTVSWQGLTETQHRTRSSGLRDISGFEVGTFGLAAQAETSTPVGDVTFGFEWSHDDVSSHRRKVGIDGTVDRLIQGPVADDATYDLLGVYVQDEIDVTDWLALTPGLRFTYAAADADRVADPRTGDEISIDDSWTNVVGSLRALARPHEAWRVHAGLGQAFRAPNLSDLTRFDSARSGEVETPSPDLEPEKFLTLDVGVRTEQDGWKAEVAAYHTWIRDLITRYPTGETIDDEAEVRKDNVGDGRVRGLEARGSVDVAAEWSVFGSIAWIDGEADVYPDGSGRKKREPLSRLAPTRGILGVRWEHSSERYWAEAQGTWADRQADLSSRDERDTQRIPPGGTPGYTVFDLRGGLGVSEGVRLFAAIENLFDRDYRVHGSGQNAPGRNVVIGFDVTF